jgi:hypothetical protein
MGRHESKQFERWGPQRVWHEAHVSIGFYGTMAHVYIMPRILGFIESEDMLASHEAIVNSAWQGRRGPVMAALNAYLDLAEAYVDTFGDENNARLKAQIGLILAQARIWLRAGEGVSWLRQLLAAEQYALNMSYSALTGVLGEIINAFQYSGYLLQAQERFEEAVRSFAVLHLYPLTSRQRGLVDLSLSQCYREMLQDEPANRDLQARLVSSLITALANLKDTPGYSKAQGMLADLKGEITAE